MVIPTTPCSFSHTSILPANFQLGDDLLLAIILLCVHEVGLSWFLYQSAASPELTTMASTQAVNFTALNRILPHLIAAAMLCRGHCLTERAPNVQLRSLLFEVLCYIFTLTAFSHGHNLPLDLAPEIFHLLFSSDEEHKGVLLGKRCRKVFSIIFQVSILQSGLASPSDLDEVRASELENIMRQLEHCPVPPSHEGAVSDDDEAVAELYRLACLIHVKKTLDPGLQDSSETIQGVLARFVSILNSLPPTSPANNIICWPLFLAGMSSMVTSHRRVIIGRLRRNYESCWRSDILSKSADLLSEKWRQDRSKDDGRILRCSNAVITQWPGVAKHVADFPLALL